MTDVDATKAQEIWDGLAQSQQNTLLSLAFNGGAGIIGTNLSAALRDKNWADAYYEIVYGSNKQKDFDGDKKLMAALTVYKSGELQKVRSLSIASQSQTNKICIAN